MFLEGGKNAQLRSKTASSSTSVRVVTTRSLRSQSGHYGHYAVTRSLRSRRSHFAVINDSKRSRSLRSHFAATTQLQRGYFALRSQRSLRGHCGRGKMKAPKLRAKAGEARTLVPCVMQIAEKFLNSSVPAQSTMIHASRRLNSMYECLSEGRWLPDLFMQASREFLLLMEGLESHFLDLKLFRLKPKAHQLYELGLDRVNPTKHWTYRDESFGHSMALLARRRGGRFSMSAVSWTVLKRFTAGNQLPRLDE